ncbi:MAG TPA: polysaccharide biosynthesis/export family protein [Stellaceae bacterium]|nr:polysaccharide biosynthesis/export family protein [Stellaceae bacterium]
MKQWLIATAVLALWAAPVLAQNLQDTQAPVPIGGSDTRGLPSRALLPPMFGASLFTGANISVQSGTPAAAPGGAASIGGTTNQTGAGGAAASQLQQAATLLSQGQASGASLAQGLAAIAGQGASSTIPATTVQPPGGLTAYDPSHVLAPGDVVQIHIYGATTLDQQATVDSNGDIFLPSIGPVHVAGVTAGSLQSAVAAAVASVYHSDADVYVTLATAVPVDVFVTGAVVAPGEYAKPSTASIITYLQAAGGIDPNRGSYRNIQVLHDGRKVESFDLYDFLLHGRLPNYRLRERDTILVGAQGPSVAAEGDVSGVFRYELSHAATGGQLTALARPYADATRITLVGMRNGRPESFSYPLRAFSQIPIENGDIVTYTPDVPTNVMTVSLDGRIDGPSQFVVTREATLFDVLPYIPIDPYFADISSVYVRRVSVAQAQLKAIQDAMQRLKAAVVTSPTITAEQAQMQQQEAQVVFQFGQQLTNVQPEGRLVVAHGGRLENVRLEDGDVIVIPSRTDLVLVSGEVRVPQAVVWVQGANLDHYINAAGGFTERANESDLLVVRPSGETLVGSDQPVRAGDRIIVLPAPSNWTLPFIKDVSQILYQVAVTTGVALGLKL